MKKLISILLIISLTAAIFAGCGNRANSMNTLKSNIAAVHTPDGRVGTAIVLDDGTLIVPSHLVDILDDDKQSQGMSFLVIYSDGREEQARLVSNDVYSDVAFLAVSSGSDNPEQTGVPTNRFKTPKEDTELFIVGVNEDGGVDEMPVSLIKSIEKEEVTALVIECESIENGQYSGAPIVDAEGNIYGLYMAGSDDGIGVGVSGESIQTIVDTLIRSGQPVMYSSGEDRSNIITDIFEEEYSLSSEDVNKIMYGSRWLSASADVSDVHFSVDQTAGSLIWLKYECLNTDPLFTYELGKDGNAVAVCYTGDNEYHYDFPRTYIRGGDTGEILLYFIELEKTVGTDSIKALAIKSQREENDAEIILNFDKSFSTDLINAEESYESIGSESESGSETGSGSESAAAAMALKNFLIENEDQIKFRDEMLIESGYSRDYPFIIDDLNLDGMPDLIYSDNSECIVSYSYNMAIVNYYQQMHLIIYDNGVLIEPDGICFRSGMPAEFSEYPCAISFLRGMAFSEYGIPSAEIVKYNGDIYIRIYKNSDQSQILHHYKFENSNFELIETITGEQSLIHNNQNDTNSIQAGPNDAIIKEIWDNCEWRYNPHDYMSDGRQPGEMTFDEAIAYLDQLIGESGS